MANDSLAGADAPAVMCCAELPTGSLAALLQPLGLQVRFCADGASIPGSYWGAPEAGLIGAQLYVRGDTPVHSALHEACHYLCADETRRAHLHTDAGGSDTEENAVCYLQILLADQLGGYSRTRIFADMQAWGYSFRLGSPAAWFREDAEDAQQWLLKNLRSPADKLLPRKLACAHDFVAAAASDSAAVQSASPNAEPASMNAARFPFS